MKKTLLLVSLISAGFGQAQSLTQANEPAIGENSTMFLCDSFATNYSGVTGNGVTWDYSQLFGYTGQTKIVEVVDATTTPDYASFPGSTKAYQIGNTIVTYFNSTASERISQGFKFYEASLGDVYATFENDPLTMVSYPFALGSSLTDAFDGTMDFTFQMTPINEALTGNVYAWIDGQGTLKFPMGIDVANVIRYRSIDTSITVLPIVGNVELIREQYEYYDLASQNLPIFLHSTITLQQAGAAVPTATVSMVLSRYTPEEWAGIDESKNAQIGVYPNPVNDKLTIKHQLNSDASGTITDLSGKVILTFDLTSGNNIDVSALSAGHYLLQINDQGAAYVQKFVKQ